MLRKSFLLLMIGEVISGIGIWLGIIGNLQFMNHLIDSDFIKSLILMSGVLASLLFLPLSGKWIDKMEKRKILIYSSMLRCLSPVCMFPALAFDSIPWMMASLILNQVTSAVYFPTVRTSLPVLVDKTELLQANTIYMNIVTISRITGTAVGGIMVASLSLNDLYLGSLGGFLILTIITCFVRIPSREGQQTGRNKEKIRFSEVFTILPKQPAVLMCIIMSSTINLFLGGFNLLVLAFSRAQDSPDVMGWIYTVEGASILIAGLFIRRFTAGFNLMIMR
ncbi:MFS transporter [Paenibacillus larvae]|nr:MFS transporter [Paenibacillus larvae]